MSKLTAESLKAKLWKTLLAVEKGEISDKEASAIAKLSGEICRVTYLQINASRELGTDARQSNLSDFILEKQTIVIEDKNENVD